MLETRAELDNFDTSYQPGRDSLAARRSGLQALDFGNYNKGFLAAWGIDVRDPTGDRRLVELCLSIPAAEFVRNGWTRSVARRAFADRLPDMVLHERRKGYQAADWHEGVAGAWPEIQQELGQISNVPQARAIIDTEGLQTLLDRRPERWEDPRVERAYRLDLLRGLSAGHFLRRATGAN